MRWNLHMLLNTTFPVCNNDSEYEAHVVGLCIAVAMNVDQIIIQGDPKVVYDHIMGSFEDK